MIRFKLANGTVIEMDNVEEVPGTLINAMLGNPVTVPVQVSSEPAPSMPVIPNHIDDESMPEMTNGKSKRTSRPRLPNPPVPEGRWPDLIYLTTVWNNAYEVLKYNPDGLTAEEMAMLMEASPLQVAGWMHRFREATPLAELIGKVYRLTAIGKDTSLRVEIADHNPGRLNKALGWQRFMALPLRDGSGRRKRRS